MVGRKLLGIVLCMLVLISFTVAAAPFTAKTLAAKKAVQIEKINYIPISHIGVKLKAQNKAKSVITQPYGKITGKIFSVADNEKKPKNPDIDKLCNTPGFACGGYEEYLYGEGDVVHYQPDATEGLPGGRDLWFHLDPAPLPGPSNPAGELGSDDFETIIDNQYMVYGPCLTARMEFDDITVPDFTGNDEVNTFSAFDAVERTENVISKCEEYAAAPRAYSCAYGANPWWNHWKVLNPDHPDDAQTMRVTIAYHGEIAACNFQLTFTEAPTVEVTDHETGSIAVNWGTSLRSSENAVITNTATSATTTVTGSTLGPRAHSLTYTGLAPGTYTAVVTSAITEDDPLVITQSINSTPVEFIIEGESTPPVITFTGGTPANGATLSSDSVTIEIATSVPVSSSRVFISNPDGSNDEYALTETSATTCTGTISGLRQGSHTYYVEATSTTGVTGTSSVRSFNVPGPSAVFEPPTPANGASQTATSATISISSNEPLSSAVLEWTTPTGTTSYSMAPSDSTHFTYSLSALAIGVYSYIVTVTDLQGDSTTTAPRTLTITTPAATPPVLTFISPTPLSGATLYSDGQEIRISSGELLASATLHLTTPGGSTASYPLSLIGGSTYSVVLDGLQAGLNAYYVDGVDLSGESGVSETRTFNVPLPLVSFIAPTPVDGAPISSGDSVTISISSNDPLASAALVWENSAGIETSYEMAELTSTSFTYSIVLDSIGVNSYRVDVVDEEGDATTSATRTVTVNPASVTPPIITFASPTPTSGSALTTDSTTIAISSSEPLTSATLHLTKPDASTEDYAMTPTSPTSYTATITELRAGTNTYYVSGVDVDEGASGSTPSRSFTVPLPIVTFVSPTPSDGASVATGTSVTVTISSNEPLSTATLVWTNPSGGTTEYAMASTSSTSFTYTLTTTTSGTNTYRVDVVDDEGDSTTTTTRSLVVERAPTPPAVTFVSPTPTSGSSQTSTSATVSISSNEPLASATLTWTTPTGATEYTMAGSGTSRTYTVSSLEVGEHSYTVTATDAEGDVTTTTSRTLTITTVPVTPPVIIFTGTTPASGSTLPSDSATITISSTEALTSATLHLTRPDASTIDFPMTLISSTSFTVSLSGLRAGSNSYYVTAIDSDEGAEGTSATRIFTAPLPTVTFVSPTPSGGDSRTTGTPVTVTISSNEPLASATLVWTDSTSTVTPYAMSSTSSTSFTYTLTPALTGTHSYRVDVVDDEGDSTTTATRVLTVTEPVPTPPVIIFSTPTPVDSITLASDSMTVAVTSDQPLASAVLSVTLVNSTMVNYSMARVTDTSYRVSVSEMINGSNTFYVTGIATDGESGTSATRSVTVPIAYLLHTFPGEAVGSMAVFGSYMYVGTFNETTGFAGNSHVYRSADGIEWTEVFTADDPSTITGIYAMTTYNDGTGNALYIGTGNLGGAADGDVWRSYDGTSWEVSYDGPANSRINILTVIDGTLYAGTTRASGTGEIMYYNSTNDWGYEGGAFPIKAIEKYGSNIYFTTANGVLVFGSAEGYISTIGGGLGANDVLSMRNYVGSLYAGDTDSILDRFASTTDPTTWEYEALAGDPQILNMRLLTDGNLYLPTLSGMNEGKLFRRTPSEANELVIDFGFNSDTGTDYDRAVDVVEFNGRKYVGAVDRIGTSGTNRLGYLFKLTN